MTEKDVIKIPTVKAFNELMDSLNLTDRQREIFRLRYSKAMTIADIAEADGVRVSERTVRKELAEIKEKLRSV